MQLIHKQTKESKHLDLTDGAQGKDIAKEFSYP